MQPTYDIIGTEYNATRRADPYLAQKLLEHLGPVQDGLYLDIGCGTGNYTQALYQEGLQLTGIDPSGKMLKQARQRNPNINWMLGSAEEVELDDETIDGITGFLTIHHWRDLERGFEELHRVLKPTGRLVLFTSTPKQMRGYWLNHYFPKMLEDSIKQMPNLDIVQRALRQSGFQQLEEDRYFVHPTLEDKFLYGGKHDPQLYLEKKIRKGISSFAALANQQEVVAGVAQLKEDIANGKIREIMASYENELGDYLFLVAEKPSPYTR
jgi:SAM-dependent methyltransferase